MPPKCPRCRERTQMRRTHRMLDRLAATLSLYRFQCARCRMVVWRFNV